MFYDMLIHNEEFVFFYNGSKYEIVSENGRSLYRYENGESIFMQSFSGNEELLREGQINGKTIADIINEIVV